MRLTVNPATGKLEPSPSVTGLLTKAQADTYYYPLSTNPAGYLTSQTPWTSNINAAGYTLYGSDAANGDLTLEGTSDATKTTSYVILQPNGGNVGIGTTSPGKKLTVANTGVTLGTISPIIAAQLTDNPTIILGAMNSVVTVDSLGWGLSFDTYKENVGPYEAMRITDKGNVGIGTVSPSTKLDINGFAGSFGVDSNAVITVENSGPDGSLGEILRMGASGQTGTGNWRNSIYSSISTNPGLSILKFSLANSQTTQADVMTLLGNGNVGIGETAPTSKLVVNGNAAIGAAGGPSGPQLYVTSGASTRSVVTISDGNTASIMLAGGNSMNGVLASDGGLTFRTGATYTSPDSGGTTAMTIASGGNVGIGETTPTAVLHLKAGTATAGTAPIKLTAGTLLSTPELGALEYVDDGTTGHLYFTLKIATVTTRVLII
jgi:hypothetical protein